MDRLRAAEATLKDEIAHMAKALLISCAVKVLVLTMSDLFFPFGLRNEFLILSD